MEEGSGGALFAQKLSRWEKPISSLLNQILSQFSSNQQPCILIKDKPEENKTQKTVQVQPWQNAVT